MGHKTNLIKYIGNIITILAIFLIFKKLISYNLDYTILLQVKTGIYMGICLIAYVINVLLSPLPWIEILKITSDCKVPYQAAVSVCTRSNILKYLPGNVFQYIGKNELAVKCGISHTKVAISTLLDVIIMFTTSSLLGILLIRKYLLAITEHYIDINLFITVVAIFLFLSVFGYLYLKKKDFISLSKIVSILKNKTNIKRILFCTFYYIIQNIWVSMIYMSLLFIISGQEVENIPFFLIIGANIISWTVGFITPGAPGGLGIREAVMILITDGIFDGSIITLSSVFYRVITIIGDVLAFLIVLLVSKIKYRDGVTEYAENLGGKNG